MKVNEAKEAHEEILKAGREVLIAALKGYDAQALWTGQYSCIWDELDEFDVVLNKDGCFLRCRFKVGKSHRTFTSLLIKAGEFSE